MDDIDARIAQALERTRVFRRPKQTLASFGVTNLRYYLVTEPVYTGIAKGEPETVVRQGVVIAERPAIVTPSYMLNLQGFGPEARRSLDLLGRRLGPNSPGLLYTYKNEPSGMEIVGGQMEAVADRVAKDLDESGKNLAVVIVGLDELWDVSLLKFIYEYTATSLVENMHDLRGRGLLDADPEMGIPRGALQRIEDLFTAVEHGNIDPTVLKMELDRWNLFERYQDRFLAIFRRRAR